MSLSIKYEQRHNDLYAWDHVSSGTLNYRTPHIHTDMELVFYHSGRTEITVDSVRYEPQAGDAILIFPNQIHSYNAFSKIFFCKMYGLQIFSMVFCRIAVIHGT